MHQIATLFIAKHYQKNLFHNVHAYNREYKITQQTLEWQMKC